MALALPASLCLVSGFLLVCLGWPRRIPAFPDYLFAASLSVGFGLGIFSLVFILFLLFSATHLGLIDVAVLALLLVAFIGVRTQTPATNFATAAEPGGTPTGWSGRILRAGFALALGSALYSAVMRTLAYPHGDGWDAFSIWNLHARLLFLGGPGWRQALTSLRPWSHPDYPLLLPAAIAHFWSYLGHDDPAVPAVIGFLFTFSTVALLFAALSILRGGIVALLGTTALLATPSFIEQGTAQYADVPLSFFIMASIALLCLHDHLLEKDRAQKDSTPSSRATVHSSSYNPGLLALAGLAAAGAAWTKNEGQLFLCAMLLARLFTLLRGRAPGSNWISGARQVAPMVVASIPALLLIAAFKHFVAPPGDLFSDSANTFHKLCEPARYWAIIRWFAKGFFRFGRWLLLPGTLLLIGYRFAAGNEERAEPRNGIRTSLLALAITLAGYFAVYLVTPYDIYWHLRFSLTRLFLQLWPSAIFLFFLLVKTSERRAAETGPGAG